MMDLGTTGNGLTHFHRAFVDEGATPIPWDRFDAGAYDAATLERGRRSWLLRTNDEYRSMTGFAELQHLVAALRAPLDVISGAARLVRDETRHVELCAHLTDLLGGRRDDVVEPRWVRTPPGLAPRLRALHHMVGSCCIGETLSVTMLRGVRAGASDPVAHAVLTQVLRDESFHARFGWLWLEATRLSDDDRSWLDRFVPRAFAAMERNVCPPDPGRPFRPSPFGAMSAADRRAAFHETVADIGDRFEALDLPGHRWWRERSLS